MGVQVVAKGVDAENYATEYAAPVRRGLEGIFFINSFIEKLARNYAPDKLSGVVVGAPSVNAGYASFKGMANYVQTQIRETTDVTFFVVARSADTPGAADSTPLICGTFDSAAPAGISLYASGTDRVAGTAAYGDDDASSTNASAIATPIVLSSWNLYSVTVNSAGVTARSHTANVSISRAATKPRRPSTRTVRIGSGYSNTQRGNVDIALYQHHSVSLTEDEIARTVADLRAYAARRGITV